MSKRREHRGREKRETAERKKRKENRKGSRRRRDIGNERAEGREERKAMGFKDEAASLADTKFYILELVAVLEYVHSEGIIHRDLKCSNLLVIMFFYPFH